MEDKILATVVRLERKVDSLTKKVTDHDKKLRYITTAALVVIGAIGGPNAAKIVTTGSL